METPTQPAEAPLILVADDVEANVELLFDQLHVLGFRAIAATDGPASVQAAFDHRPDLCILDVAMPAGDLGCDDRNTGFEVCRRIKRDPRTARVPVIFVTALSDTTDRVKAIEAGGDDFLTKPHNRLVLGARVRSLLRLKGAMDALEESSRKMRELEKLRDDLMKMIVHDLKSPLTSVLANLELLQASLAGADQAEDREVVDSALRSSRRMSRLVSDLLLLARADAGQLGQHGRCDLAEIAGEAAAEAAPLMGERHLVVDNDRPVRVEGNTDELHRMVLNLLDNAARHTPPHATVELSLREDDGAAVLEVADDGPGIPAAMRSQIFDRFVRGEGPADTARGNGTGLGLAIVSAVAASHGGSVEATESASGGALFRARIPIARPEAQPRDHLPAL